MQRILTYTYIRVYMRAAIKKPYKHISLKNRQRDKAETVRCTNIVDSPLWRGVMASFCHTEQKMEAAHDRWLRGILGIT